MPTFNLKSVLKGYKRLFGMTAEVYNENGDLLDSVDLNNSRKRFSFFFDQDTALQGADNADLTIKLIDTNGDARNFSRSRGRTYDLEADEQTFIASIPANKRRKRVKLNPSTEELDNAAPVFNSGAAGSVDENVAPGTLVYDAEASDASSISYALNGGDSAAFSINPQTGQVTINQSPDFEAKPSYSFNVVATDAHGNAASQAVTININDVEEGQGGQNQTDNLAPSFTSGATGFVDENVAPGTLVYDAEASDASSVSYALNGGDSAAFSINPQTGQVTINQSPDFEAKPSYSFNVVATDAHGNAASQGVTIRVNDVEENQPDVNNPNGEQQIQLTPLLDTISAEDLSNQSDAITADLGTLGNGFLDSIMDGSNTDNDHLTIYTNATFDIDETLDSDQINRIHNIENIQIIANNDDAGERREGFLNLIKLDKIVNLKTLDIDGTFTDRLDLRYWASTGATSFDYSGVTSTEGVNAVALYSGNSSFAEDLNIKGSAGDDTFSGLMGNVTMDGGGGNDGLFGSSQGQSTIAGGAGTDSIMLFLHDAQHTVQLHGQTSETSKDTILFNTFQGFNNANAQSLNTFDLIEIDAATFTNYSAGLPVRQQTLAAANFLGRNLTNTVITSNSLASLKSADLDALGNGILGFASDDGVLVYSASGNFSADAQELFSIGAEEGANFVPTRQINVV